MALASAKALGARRIVAVEVAQDRLDFARSYAATDAFKPPKKKEGESGLLYAERAINELFSELGFGTTGTEKFDLVIECSGAEPCIQMAFHAVASGGTVVQVGLGRDEVTIPLMPHVFKCVRMPRVRCGLTHP
jgi:D-xylulose reductase